MNINPKTKKPAMNINSIIFSGILLAVLLGAWKSESSNPMPGSQPEQRGMICRQAAVGGILRGISRASKATKRARPLPVPGKKPQGNSRKSNNNVPNPAIIPVPASTRVKKAESTMLWVFIWGILWRGAVCIAAVYFAGIAFLKLLDSRRATANTNCTHDKYPGHIARKGTNEVSNKHSIYPSTFQRGAIVCYKVAAVIAVGYFAFQGAWGAALTVEVEPAKSRASHYLKMLHYRLDAAKKAHDEGRYVEAARLYTAELTAEKAKANPNLELLSLLNNQLGLSLHELGQYDKALEHYQKALDIWLKKLGPDHPSVATSYHHIGCVQFVQGEFNKGREYFQKAHAILLNKLGPNHPRTKKAKVLLDRSKGKGGGLHNQADANWEPYAQKI